ncbi:hypothetical protein Tco_1539180 [Tanacetum coccineum]
MNPIATQQAALDNALVPPEKRLKIERCNARIAFSKLQKEETYQVILEALKLSPCYPAFQITLDKKKCRVDTEFFHEILHICPIILNQDFIVPPLEEELDTFIQELGYSGRCNMLSAIHTDQMHQPWRTFVAIINRKNVDYVAMLWEDFMYQADNREISSARKEHMPYPRFTKVIINYFISKDKTISMRNSVNLHTIRDDSLLGTLKFVFKTQDYQQYGALIPDDMINQDIKDSNAYKTCYDFATGKVPPRKARKYKKATSPSRNLSPVKEVEPVKKAKRVKRPAKKSTTVPTAGVVVRDTPGVSVSKKKATAKADKSKGDETDLESRVPDEQQRKTSGTNEGTGTIPGVLDVPKYQSESDDESWGNSKDHNDDNSEDGNDDDVSKGDDDKVDSNDDDGDEAHDSERTDSDDDDENPPFTLKDYNEEEHDEEYEYDDDNENVFEEEDDDDDLYKDVYVRSLGTEHEKERKFVEDAHVTFTDSQKTDDSKQSSFASSNFANQFLIVENAPPSDHEVASLMNIKMSHEVPSTQIPSPLIKPTTVIPYPSTIASTTVPLTILIISPLPQLMTPTPVPTTALTTTSIPALPNFSFLFGFDHRVSALETKLSLLKQADLSTQLYIDVVEKSVKDIIKDEVKNLLPQILPKEVSNFATLVIQSTITESLENVVLVKSSSQPQSTYEATTSLIEFELKKILLDKLEKSKSYRAAEDHRNLYDALIKSYQLDKDLFDSYGKAYSLKRSREDKDKDEDPSAGPDQGLKKKKSSKDDEPSRGSKSKESKSSSSKGSKSMQAEELVFETADIEMPQDQEGDTEDQPNVEATPMDDWFKKPNKPPTPNRPWNYRKSIDSRLPHKWISNIAKARQPPRTFDELMSTPIEFSAYVMHNLKIDNLTQEILVGPAFNLLKGTCKSFVELEYHFEKCYKAITDQLDWKNPEGHEYPFDLSKPLSLIKAQGIEDMVLELWSPVKVAYGKFAMWVTHVKVMKYYGYGYLEEIIVRREDQTLHKFKEGDFPRLNLRDIEDLLLRLKKLNITKPETFRSDISKLTSYTAYKNPQGIIYQDKFKRNRLMRSDELYKFCDGTLTSVQRVLHNIANHMRMDYLPKRRWSNLDRKRSRIMIKAIDQQLFERRLMRKLEKSVGGREYRNDFRLLERTI